MDLALELQVLITSYLTDKTKYYLYSSTKIIRSLDPLHIIDVSYFTITDIYPNTLYYAIKHRKNTNDFLTKNLYIDETYLSDIPSCESIIASNRSEGFYRINNINVKKLELCNINILVSNKILSNLTDFIVKGQFDFEETKFSCLRKFSISTSSNVNFINMPNLEFLFVNCPLELSLDCFSKLKILKLGSDAYSPQSWPPNLYKFSTKQCNILYTYIPQVKEMHCNEIFSIYYPPSLIKFSGKCNVRTPNLIYLKLPEYVLNFSELSPSIQHLSVCYVSTFWIEFLPIHINKLTVHLIKPFNMVIISVDKWLTFFDHGFLPEDFSEIKLHCRRCTHPMELKNINWKLRSLYYDSITDVDTLIFPDEYLVNLTLKTVCPYVKFPNTLVNLNFTTLRNDPDHQVRQVLFPVNLKNLILHLRHPSTTLNVIVKPKLLSYFHTRQKFTFDIPALFLSLY